MSTTTSLSADYLEKLVDSAQLGGSAALDQGPFFFGIFLVLVAVVLILLNKNRYISSFFAVCGILLMVWASLLYSGIVSPSINAYNMRIDNLQENHRLVLTNSPPRLYRHNRVYDTESETYSIDLITVSTAKLEKGYSFTLILKEIVVFSKPDGTSESKTIKQKINLSFEGDPSSTYELREISTEEEEGLGNYELVANVSEEPKRISPAFLWSLFREARANEAREQDDSSLSSVVRLAQANAGDVSAPAPDSGSEQTKHDATDITVIYFERSVDQGKVSEALVDSNVDYVIKRSSSSKLTNAVWIGVDVPSDLAERIGSSLLSKGVDLKHFGYFTYPDTKTNVVQIGYSRLKATDNSVTRSDIVAFTEELHDQRRAAQAQDLQLKKTSQFLQQQQEQQQRHQQVQKSGADLWGIVFGGDKTHNAALHEINRAKKSGYDKAQVYSRKNRFRSVVAFADKASAQSGLPGLRNISTNKDAYIVDLNKWCQSPVLRQDALGIFFECK